MSMVAVLRPASDEQLEELFARPEAIEELLDEPSSEEVDIDKAWHGLHYLLTGTAWEGAPPLNFLAAGGREVGEVESGTAIRPRTTHLRISSSTMRVSRSS